MSVVARIQHHPSRAHLLPDLCKRLEPLEINVITHSSEPPDPWAGYRLCLSDLPDCSHVLIVQDDALPVPNFAQAVLTIAETQPSKPVCLFLSGLPSSAAIQARQTLARDHKYPRRYILLGPSNILPLVCTLWPRHLAEDFLAWSETSNRITRADDGNAARWMLTRGQEVLCTVPSICEHNDWTESVKGGQPARWGGDAGRVAVLLADDAASYDWSTS